MNESINMQKNKVLYSNNKINTELWTFTNCN